ncbi:MAG: bacillithiol biosynthesis deacetylase BshB1 [Rhodothermales bacterium]|nr:bacillithiol biosynthesis deacetylase BshB1 [Rhodothermales bacterium]
MDTHSGLDVLAFAAHPDDVELCAGGTICTLVDRGARVGIVDLTRGELGSRGSAELRMQEATRAGDVLGVTYRSNLGLPDGDIRNTPDTRMGVIRELRRHRPRIILINPPECRHPDHAAAARLVADAAFYSGLRRIEVSNAAHEQVLIDRRSDPGPPERTAEPLEPWRPQYVLHYMQAVEFEPTIVVDVSDVWERRTNALLSFESQFHNPEYRPGEDEPETFVSNPEFMKWIEARARVHGYRIGARYGEPLLLRQAVIGTDDLAGLLNRDRPFR